MCCHQIQRYTYTLAYVCGTFVSVSYCSVLTRFLLLFEYKPIGYTTSKNSHSSDSLIPIEDHVWSMNCSLILFRFQFWSRPTKGFRPPIYKHNVYVLKSHWFVVFSSVECFCCCCCLSAEGRSELIIRMFWLIAMLYYCGPRSCNKAALLEFFST